MKNKNGFTLIELIASIALILLLFIAIVPISLNLIEKSNKEQCEEMSNVIETNAELCVLDKNSICINNNNEYYVSLIDLYNNGYIDEKYENAFSDQQLNLENEYQGYKIKITKITSNINTTKSYLNYELVDVNNNNPCSN